MKYRKKPVVIEAFQFDGTVDCLRKNVDKKDWFRFEFEYADPTASIDSLSLKDRYSFEVQDYAYSFGIATLEGLHRLLRGDYVIKGVHGEYYPCKPDIFEETYELVKDDEVTYRYSFKFVREYASMVNSIPDNEMDGIIDKVREYMQDQIESYLYKKTLNEE